MTPCCLHYQTKPRRENRPGSFIPSRPLAEAVHRIIYRASIEADATPDTKTGAVCKRVGIDPRTLNAWAAYERPTITVEVADRALVNTYLHWWDVWNEQTVREPVFTVTVYRHENKMRRTGVRRPARVKARRIPYGDLGTDYAALNRIARAFTGDTKAAA